MECVEEEADRRLDPPARDCGRDTPRDHLHLEELAIAAVATIGLGFILLALVGGFIGALIAGRRRG
jgi:hypothetical protein